MTDPWKGFELIQAPNSQVVNFGCHLKVPWFIQLRVFFHLFSYHAYKWSEGLADLLTYPTYPTRPFLVFLHQLHSLV